MYRFLIGILLVSRGLAQIELPIERVFPTNVTDSRVLAAGTTSRTLHNY
jgi:hypothetical protein